MSTRLEQLRKLAAAEPHDPMAHYAVALELVQLDRVAEAVDAFDAALRADPRYSAAYYHKGKALLKLGRNDEARATLTEGIAVAQTAGDLKTVKEMTELRSML
jgi:tetratricopeptide (TPR) repeat protein